jgi:mannose-6-phosphate isomerase
MQNDILFFEPHLDERLWGGDHLRHLYNPGSGTAPIGEAWLISGMPNASSRISRGRFANMTLSDFFASNPDYFNFPDAVEFPLLVKWIDAHAKLSVQVHPDDDYAQNQEHSRGKTECWYITEAQPEAFLILGHEAKTKEELARRVQSGDFSRLFKEVSIKKDDFVYIPAGLLHAIGDGVRLVEIQQASDITYRVYDYDRRDDQGNKRPLHLEKALAVTTVPSPEIVIRNVANTVGIVTLVESPFFSVEKWSVANSLDQENYYQETSLFVVLDGQGSIQQTPYKTGDAFIVPGSISLISLQGNASLLRAFLPRRNG